MMLLLLLLSPPIVSASAIEEEIEMPHESRQLVFQPVLIPGKAEKLQAVLRVVHGKESNELLLSLTMLGDDLQNNGASVKNLCEVTTRVHLSGGQIVETVSTDLERVVAVFQNRWGSSAVTSRSFSLRMDQFDEAWIEMTYDGNVLWFRIPWGFTRDP